jgi:hypothetical protein
MLWDGVVARQSERACCRVVGRRFAKKREEVVAARQSDGHVDMGLTLCSQMVGGRR